MTSSTVTQLSSYLKVLQRAFNKTVDSISSYVMGECK